MKKAMWWFAVLLLLAAPAAARIKTSPLFVIEPIFRTSSRCDNGIFVSAS